MIKPILFREGDHFLGAVIDYVGTVQSTQLGVLSPIWEDPLNNNGIYQKGVGGDYILVRSDAEGRATARIISFSLRALEQVVIISEKVDSFHLVQGMVCGEARVYLNEASWATLNGEQPPSAIREGRLVRDSIDVLLAEMDNMTLNFDCQEVQVSI